MNLNIAIDRAFLKTTTQRVKHHFPTIRLGDATVSRIREGRYYFTIAIDGHHFATYVSGLNVVEARRKGWEEFLRANHVEA